MELLVLSRNQVRQALTMRDAIEHLRTAFRDFHRGLARMPGRQIMPVCDSDDGVRVLTMAGGLVGRAVTVKLSSIAPLNSGRGLPLSHGLVVLIDSQTGVPLCLMDGGELTALRTGAMGGLATDILSRVESRSLAIVGCGVQARYQLIGVCAVRQIRHVSLYSRTESSARSLAEWIESQSLAVRNVSIESSAARALRDADIACTTTSTPLREPIIKAGDVPLGLHLNAIGGVNEHACEVCPSLLDCALVTVESLDAAQKEAGEIIAALEQGVLRPSEIRTLGGIIDGQAAGRTSSEQITIFKSVGVAIQDVAVANAVYAAALVQGLGTSVAV